MTRRRHWAYTSHPALDQIDERRYALRSAAFGRPSGDAREFLRVSKLSFRYKDDRVDSMEKRGFLQIRRRVDNRSSGASMPDVAPTQVVEMAPKQKRVFFHVGSVKTGSTFIQKFLYDNRATFAENEIDYLLLSPLRLDLPRYANGEFLLAKDFDQQAVVSAVEGSACSNVLFSDEALVARPDVITNDAFRDFGKTVVLYVRPPVDLIASWATEGSLPYNYWKGGQATCNGIVPVEKSIPRLLWEYHVTMRNFLDVIEKRPDIQLLIRPYAQEKFANKHLLTDFVSVFGLNVSKSMLDAIDLSQTANSDEGKTRKYCDLTVLCADAVQRYGASAQFSYQLVDYVYAACKSGDDRKVADTLSDEEMDAIHAALKPTYDRLRARGSVFDGFDKTVLSQTFGGRRAPYKPVIEKEAKAIIAEYLFKA